MAERYAVANGNWSNTATWDGGTLPTSSDDVYANTYTVTIDQNVTVLSLRGTAGTTALAGGAFTTSGAVIVTVTDKVYGGTVSSGTVRINSGAELIGDATTSLINLRRSVQINAGGKMTGDAVLGKDCILVQPGGVLYGNALGENTHNGVMIEIRVNGVMYGNSYAGGSQYPTVVNGGLLIGNAYGGTAAGTQGAMIQNNGRLVGDSYAGTSTSFGAEIRMGGIQFGTAYGNSNYHGTYMQDGFFIGNAVGGNASGCYGLFIDNDADGFAEIETATGNTAGAFGVYAAGYAKSGLVSTLQITIKNEVGDYAKSLSGDVITDGSLYPFPAGGSQVFHPLGFGG